MTAVTQIPGGVRLRSATAAVVGSVRRSSPSTVVALVFIGAVLILSFVVPLLPGADPYSQSLGESLIEPLTDSAHLLGTDQLGRDVLSRLALATQMSLLIAVGAVLISAILGLVVGLVAGYRGGRIDTVLMGIGDVQLAIPVVLLLIVLVATLGSSPALLVILLGLTNWVTYGRVVRAVVFSLREQEFVTAAVSAGASAGWVIRRHLLRNVLPQVLILSAFQIGVVITIESSLSFIGLGIQPPTPSLGLMINEGQRYLQSDPWMTIVPAAAVFLLIAGAQFLSQAFERTRSS
ncbi:ABC transporter permease [Microbacterium sp. 179-B 1A2 NHS]|uniref:ABC transporter permease n=1 Tax=Microbacterium sp. 179-B 1A2 NHS TaxID=3142383 RepID=UPI00399F66CB